MSKLYLHFANELIIIYKTNDFISENVTLNPGDEKQYSILTGDTLTLQCPVNTSKKSIVRWSYMKDTQESILSIGGKLNAADFSFNVDFTNHLQNVAYLRIYNITSKEQRIYKCYHSLKESNIIPFEYDYNIRLANVTVLLIKYTNGSVCCVLHGPKISSNKFMWEQRTLYGEHIRFIESVLKKDSGTFKRDANLAMHKYNYLRSCLNLNKNGIVKYDKEGEYICIAQFFIHGRNAMVDKTTSFKIENIQDRPFCIQDIRREHSILRTNIRVVMNFYSKPRYSALSVRKNDNELKLGDYTVNIKNISLDVYNVTVMVSGYEIIINITEFSEEDIGNYTANISNRLGYCNCTVQLLCEGLLLMKRFLGNGNFIVPFVLLVVAVISNIFIHLYCKKLKKVMFETDDNDISRERIEMTEADNGYHTINEDNFRIDDTEIQNQSEITISIGESLDISEVQFLHGAASDGNELQIEEDDYLHPYCTVMQNTIEMHEYKTIIPEVAERDISDVVLNRESGRLYENLKF
ncbi:unnamed protein product [Mytilus coruscus]|uniref:Ig-like domain-containing protein n=1 Tax=Mytilus coruscus TaxID=42192 RepID=A0A6J8DV79_MYTCO|nr:unnamed protein product [Mytilus coruscus]